MHHTWTVTEAKAHLSEILRKAETEGPQQVGLRDPRIIITTRQWEELTGQKISMGDWLLQSFTKTGEIELPTRKENEREEFF